MLARISLRICAPTLLALAVLAGASEARAIPNCLFDAPGVNVSDAPFVCGRAVGQAYSPNGVGAPTTTNGTDFLNTSGGSVDLTVIAAGGIGASANATGDFGVLKAFSQGVLGSWSAPTASPTADGFAIAEVAFADRILLTSSVLPVGTPVDLTAIVSVNGAFGVNFAGVGLVQFFLGTATSFVAFGPINLTNANPSYYQEFAFTPVIGDEFFVRLGIRAGSGATNGPVPSAGFADMLSTGELFLRADTPGLDIQSASGHSYALVPEPVTALLLLAALLGVVGPAASRTAA